MKSIRPSKFFSTFSGIVVLFVAAVSNAEPVATKKSEADAAFEKQDYTTARELYIRQREQYRGAEHVEQWKKTTAQIVRCSTALDDAERAVEEYFVLCRVEPLTPLDHIPLPWFTNPSSTAQPRTKTAEDWLDPLQTKIRSPSATLLAAGVLTTSKDNAKRLRGLQVLRDISSLSESDAKVDSKDKNAELQRQVGQLANILLWKQQVPRLRSKNDLAPLRRQLEQLPESLRAGPCFLFGQAARQVGEHEDAVLAWMRVPILYPENRPLAAEALREAAKSLEKLGRVDQAEKLRHEADERTSGAR